MMVCVGVVWHVDFGTNRFHTEARKPKPSAFDGFGRGGAQASRKAALHHFAVQHPTNKSA